MRKLAVPVYASAFQSMTLYGTQKSRFFFSAPSLQIKPLHRAVRNSLHYKRNFGKEITLAAANVSILHTKSGP